MLFSLNQSGISRTLNFLPHTFNILWDKSSFRRAKMNIFIFTRTFGLQKVKVTIIEVAFPEPVLAFFQDPNILAMGLVRCDKTNILNIRSGVDSTYWYWVFHSLCLISSHNFYVIIGYGKLVSLSKYSCITMIFFCWNNFIASSLKFTCTSASIPYSITMMSLYLFKIMHWDNKHSFISADYEVAMLCLFKYMKYMFVIVTEYYLSCIYNLRRYVDRYFDESSYLPFRIFLKYHI